MIAKENVCIIVIGANGTWGKADSVREAMRLASRPKNYIAYLAPKDASVTDMGSIRYNREEFVPIEIDRKEGK